MLLQTWQGRNGVYGGPAEPRTQQGWKEAWPGRPAALCAGGMRGQGGPCRCYSEHSAKGGTIGRYPERHARLKFIAAGYLTERKEHDSVAPLSHRGMRV